MNGTPAIPCVDFEGWAAAWEERNRSKQEADNINEQKRDKETIETIARDLTNACRSVGFAYVINHGISDDLLAEAFSWSKKFFDLPLDQKMLAPHPPGPDIHRGYSYPGLEKVSQDIIPEGDDGSFKAAVDKNRAITDVKESYEIGSEQDKLQPNVWLPGAEDEDKDIVILPGFRTFMTEFYQHCFSTSQHLLRALAVGLGLDEEEAREFTETCHRGHNNQLRLLHYPPIERDMLLLSSEEDASSSSGYGDEEDQEKKKKKKKNMATRMPAHSDWGTITLLFQEEEEEEEGASGGGGGLQVEDPTQEGKFLHAYPRKGALIMNVGDLLMRWSNDTLKSTLHRVGPPPEVTTAARTTTTTTTTRGNSLLPSRYSIPYFVAPEPDTVVKCLSSCCGPQRPAKYEPITQDEYRRMRGRGQY